MEKDKSDAGAGAGGKRAVFEQEYFLTPAECDPQGRMPVTLLINRLIEVATLHANELGIGFASLVDRGETWVLSRVAVEMGRYPRWNETYRIATWVCSINRLFSERDFEITDGEGRPLGHARTVWAVMNTHTRQVADISRMEWIRELVPDRDCPIAKPSRLRPLTAFESHPYRFTYCDLDFNRHVNSSRYIELLLNQWGLDFHDRHRLERFEIAYIREAVYGEEVEVRICGEPGEAARRGSLHPTSSGEVFLAELAHGGEGLCRALLRFGETGGAG